MDIKIVSDSSSNVLKLEGTNFQSVPLKIISESKEYVDNEDLDISGLIEDMSTSKEKFSSSCPNAFEWEEAFEGADNIFALAITSELSGSYSAAVAAAKNFKSKNPGKKICVLDTRNTGPGMQLMIENILNLQEKGLSFEEIEKEARAYINKVNLSFSLESLNNLAKNGRINHAVAKIAGVLGIRVVAKAVDGNIKITHKCRGERKAIEAVKNDMLEAGFKGGKVRISHCENEPFARQIKDWVKEVFPETDVDVISCGALCSFYAERGGVLVGYEV